jgi:hypothetical protein
VADSKQEETFKVIDRRHFTEAGEVRPEAADLDRREEAAAAKRAASQPPPAPKPEPAATVPAAKASTAESSGPTLVTSPASEEIAQAEGEAESGEPLSPSSRSFQLLIDFLTRNAAAMMGGMADPRTGQPFVDLEGAREMIDMLDALREKTMGNLSKDDEQLLIEVLGSLKLTFMEISKAAAEAMAKKGKIGSIRP